MEPASGTPAAEDGAHPQQIPVSASLPSNSAIPNTNSTATVTNNSAAIPSNNSAKTTASNASYPAAAPSPDSRYGYDSDDDDDDDDDAAVSLSPRSYHDAALHGSSSADCAVGGVNGGVEINTIMSTASEFSSRFVSRQQPTAWTSFRRSASQYFSSLTAADVIKGTFPIFGYDFRNSYSFAHLQRDVLTGLTLAVIMIPQGLSYAPLVGLPAEYGLYASFFPVIMYTMMGTSTEASVGPFAVASLILGQQILSAFPEIASMTDQAEITALVLEGALSFSFWAGMLLALLGLLRCGWISSLISEPAVKGFLMASALNIITSQASAFFQIKLAADASFFEAWIRIFGHINNTNVAALLIGLIATSVLMYIDIWAKRRKLKKPIPSQILLIIVATLISYLAGFHDNFDVGIVGKIKDGFPTPQFPKLGSFASQIGGALILALVVDIVSVATSQQIAAQNGYTISPDQEMRALGVSAMVGSMFSAYMPCVSLSRSAVTNQLKPATILWNLFLATVVLLCVMVAGPLLFHLPKAILSSVVISSFRGMLMELPYSYHLWFVSPIESVSYLVPFLVTLAVDSQWGVIAAFAISIIVLLFHTARPGTRVLGRLPGTEQFKSVEKYPEARDDPSLLVFRFDARLHFANQDFFYAKLTGLVDRKLALLRSLEAAEDAIAAAHNTTAAHTAHNPKRSALNNSNSDNSGSLSVVSVNNVALKCKQELMATLDTAFAAAAAAAAAVAAHNSRTYGSHPYYAASNQPNTKANAKRNKKNAVDSSRKIANAAAGKTSAAPNPSAGNAGTAEDAGAVAVHGGPRGDAHGDDETSEDQQQHGTLPLGRTPSSSLRIINNNSNKSNANAANGALSLHIPSGSTLDSSSSGGGGGSAPFLFRSPSALALRPEHIFPPDSLTAQRAAVRWRSALPAGLRLVTVINAHGINSVDITSLTMMKRLLNRNKDVVVYLFVGLKTRIMRFLLGETENAVRTSAHSSRRQSQIDLNGNISNNNNNNSNMSTVAADAATASAVNLSSSSNKAAHSSDIEMRVQGGNTTFTTPLSPTEHASPVHSGMRDAATTTLRASPVAAPAAEAVPLPTVPATSIIPAISSLLFHDLSHAAVFGKALATLAALARSHEQQRRAWRKWYRGFRTLCARYRAAVALANGGSAGGAGATARATESGNLHGYEDLDLDGNDDGCGGEGCSDDDDCDDDARRDRGARCYNAATAPAFATGGVPSGARSSAPGTSASLRGGGAGGAAGGSRSRGSSMANRSSFTALEEDSDGDSDSDDPAALRAKLAEAKAREPAVRLAGAAAPLVRMARWGDDVVLRYLHLAMVGTAANPSIDAAGYGGSYGGALGNV